MSLHSNQIKLISTYNNRYREIIITNDGVKDSNVEDNDNGVVIEKSDGDIRF